MAAYADLARILAAKQKQIVELWLERTLNSYKSPGFFIKSQDSFANPVGMQVRSGLTTVFELLRDEAGADTYARPLDLIVRIRAVQYFSASQAVVPFLELKWVVEEVLGGDVQTGPLVSQLNEFDCAVERVALMAFDLYSQCREQLYLNRIHELKSGRARFTDGGCPSRLLDADGSAGG